MPPLFQLVSWVCASDSGSKPLLQVDLEHALNGTAVTGAVTQLLTLPQASICTGTFEAEGVDYDTQAKVLRAEVVPPSICAVSTAVYSYVPTTG